MKILRHLSALLALAAGASSVHAASTDEIDLYAGRPMPSWSVSIGSLEAPLSGMAGVRVDEVAGRQGALALQWKDVWSTSLRFDGGAALDLRPYTASGTLEFDLNVQELGKGGIYIVMRCGQECYRKVPFVLPGQALQGKGWQHLSFALSCFARHDDDFGKVNAPFALEANGSGQVALADIRFVRNGKPNQACSGDRAQAVTPEPLSHAWALPGWLPRHEKKLEEVRKLKAAGKSPKLVFIGDSITEGWENSGKAVWQRYYAKYDAVALGFGGDHTENVLWRLRHGEVDGIAPRVAVLMIGTNNTGDRNDDPAATAAGVKAIIDELHGRLPKTKVLLLAVFPREEQPSALLRRLNESVNAIIANYADGRSVFFANINAALLNADGTLSRDVMPDLLHPQERGYEIWARNMEPTLRKLLAE
ncbi:1,4-beta-D-glucan glucohydrolase [Pseudoduganella eburnea]|uniref:1,4-beta-D-glucan glucohydrolase n=1 Tax=Massilia eburnea TaxID=1776165 RepID=A0A6L6QE41_9BURK|nr:GDSL-type esterase/lipase family protein [Massilia eburnea]MTW09953.1 1,4-beta-D-glucan glucohydrolase [Massilia eburnea]